MANLSQSLLKGAKAYQGQNVVDRNELVVKYAPLVKRVALHLKARLPASVDINDLVQSGMIGLIEALQNFKEGQGATFETYASIRIRGAIIDQLRQSDWTPRSVHQNTRAIRDAMLRLSHEKGRPATDVEIAQYLNVDIKRYHQMLLDSNTSQVMGIEDTGLTDDVIGDKPLSEIVGQSPDDKLFEALNGDQFKEALARAIGKLPEREREVLTFYYDQEMNLREIGLIKGISESRTCQILSQAVTRLRASLSDWANPPKAKHATVTPREQLLAPGSQAQPNKKRVSLLFNDNDEIEMRTAHGRALQQEREVQAATPPRKKRAAKGVLGAQVSITDGINKEEQELFVFINKTRDYIAKMHERYSTSSVTALVTAEPSIAGAQKMAQDSLLLQEALSKFRKFSENAELKVQELTQKNSALAVHTKTLAALQEELTAATDDFLEFLHQVNTAYQQLNPELKAKALSELAQGEAPAPTTKPKRTVRAALKAPKAAAPAAAAELTVVKAPRRRRSAAS